MATSITTENSTVNVTVIDEILNVNVCENIVEVSMASSGPQGPRGTQVLSGAIDPSPVIGLIGDQYINTVSGYIFGPKTESGWGEGTSLGFGLTISDISYTHYQVNESDVWTIVHPLQFNPSITVVGLDGKVIEGDYQYTEGTIIAIFSNPITGAAYLS